MKILFLGKYDESMHLLEEEVINMQKKSSPSRAYDFQFNESVEPDVKKYPIDNCDVWATLGNVKPTVLLKPLISRTDILLFIFNFSEMDTLTFLTEGWGPIVRKSGIVKPECQKRILVGTKCDSMINSKDVIKKIKDAMESLGCKQFFGQGLSKNENLEPFSIIKDLTKYISDQIKKEKLKSAMLDKPSEKHKVVSENNKSENLLNNINEKENVKEEFVSENKKDQLNASIKLDEPSENRKIVGENNKSENLLNNTNEKENVKEEVVSENNKSENLLNNINEKENVKEEVVSENNKSENLLNNTNEKENMKEEVVSENKKVQLNASIKLGNNVILNFILMENTAKILSVQNLLNIFIVPESVQYENKFYTITDICDRAFEESNIVSLSFEQKSQVRSIGNYAFRHSKIQSLLLPARLEKLSQFWCAEAENLTIVNIDSRNRYFKSINNFLIKNSTSEVLFAPRDLIRYIQTPGYIGNFYINNNKVSFGDYCYYGATNLQRIEISSEEMYIGDFCFSNNKKLSSFEIICTKKLKIGKNCFENCCFLSYISIKNESIDDLTISMNTFCNCKSLIDITINNKSKLILENKVFLNNDKLQKVYLKGSSVIIGDRCFKDCFIKSEFYSNYNYLKVESESIVEIGKNCFECSNIKNFEISGTEVFLLEGSFIKCSLLMSFMIKNANKVLIENFSFENCSKLNTITFIDISFLSLKPNALFGCRNLMKFNLTLKLIFDLWNDYDIKQTPLKTGNSSNLYILQKKETKELFVLKQLLQKNKYKEFLNIFIKQIISLSKKSDLLISDFCGYGIIKLNSNSEAYLAIMTKNYSNGSLDDVFSQKIQLPDTKKYILILGITYEMKLLHSYGFHYPNLPPEKILLDENYYPHLNVLGYSKQTEPTIYTAPEFLEEKYGYKNKQKSDIYSYSLIIYELLTGEKPYNNSPMNEIKQNILNGFRPDLTLVKDKILQDFFKRCWDKLAFDRPDFEEIFNEIIKERFISLFDVNEEEVYNYMKILNIPEPTETVDSNGISFELHKFSKTSKITKVDKSIESFQLPKFYKSEKTEYTVNEICDKVFSQCYNLKSITFPQGSSIVRIGNLAFEYSSLAQVNIDTDQNITIEKEVFQICDNLKSVIIKSSKTLIISNKCFYCSKIESFEAIANHVEICDYCFSFSNLCSLKITSKEKLKICQNIFDECNSLSSISIENESNEDLIISQKSFANRNSLESITIRNYKSALIFEKEIFSLNSKLRNVFISGKQIIFEEKSFHKSFDTMNAGIKIESQTFIIFEQQSFEECNFETVDIKCKEVHIEEESFSKCLNLTKFDISGSIEVFIEKYAFKCCSNLTSISFNEVGYFKIRTNALFGCHKLNIIQLKLTQSFASSKYYQSKCILHKRDLSIDFLFIKKETNEQYIAKKFKMKEYYKELEYFLNQVIKISKEDNPIVSDVFECGLFIFNKEHFFTVVSKFYVNNSLNEALSKKTLSNTQKYIILLGTTIGMKYIESNKIVHQKLTSKRILLDESFYPHLNNLDSPEIEQSNDIKSDVYSFATILYQLFVDSNAINSPNKKIQIDQIQNKEIKNLLIKCLMSEPNKRPTFSEIFDEITNIKYLNYFNAKEQKINEYLDLFKIELNEDILLNGIHYFIFKRSKTAKIVKICENVKFEYFNNFNYKGRCYLIIEICDEAFLKINQSHYIKLCIPGSVEKIGIKSFANLNNIDEVTFNSNNLNIGFKCFSKCKSLKTISFNSAENIKFGANSFEGCEQLQNIFLNKSNRIELEEKCFSNLKRITSINFQSQYLSVGTNCFESCNSLKSFSCTVSKILFSSQPFNQCSRLEEITIEYDKYAKTTEYTNNDIIINDNFFNGCSSLKSVVINTDQKIFVSTTAFVGCNSLKEVKLSSSSSVTLSNKNTCTVKIQLFEAIGKQVYLDDKCFNSSDQLQSLKIECHELIIGNFCFSDCINLESVSFELKKIALGSNAFYNCSKIYNFYINSIPYKQTSQYIKIEHLDIGDHCFSNCKSLNSIYFGQVQNGKLGSCVFENCNITSFYMENSVNLEIEDYCFTNATKLERVKLSADHMKAGNFLFDKCNSIKNVSLKGLKSESISNDAYSGINLHLINNDNRLFSVYFDRLK